MKVTILINLLTLLLKQIDPEDMREIADKGLDYLEDRYSGNMPVQITCKLIRTSFDIPDNDEPAAT